MKLSLLVLYILYGGVCRDGSEGAKVSQLGYKDSSHENIIIVPSWHIVQQMWLYMCMLQTPVVEIDDEGYTVRPADSRGRILTLCNMFYC